MNTVNLPYTAWGEELKTCPCCGCDAFPLVIHSRDFYFNRPQPYAFYQCRDCLTLVLNAGQDWSFANAYPRTYGCHQDLGHLKWHHRVLRRYHFPIPPIDASGPIVDIGCGTGLLVHYLSTFLPDVQGIEPCQDAVQIAAKCGRRVIQGDWESFQAEEGTVGVLILNQVIEHLVSSPKAVFKKASSLLKPGGYWLIRTPNAASEGFRLFRKYWHPLETPRHTIIYSSMAIEHLAENYAFSVIGKRHCGMAYDIVQSMHYQKSTEGVLYDNPLRYYPFPRVLAYIWNQRRKGDNMEFILQKT